MTFFLEMLCWLAVACVAYTYFLYPLAVALLVRLRRPPLPPPEQQPPRAVSIVLTAYNEEALIERRLLELAVLAKAAGLEADIIVVSDGSTDATAAVVRRLVGESIRLLELPDHQGKAAALTKGCAVARHEILVFADVRQTWEPETLPWLLANFADPSVGAVSGDLVLESAPGVLAGVGLYWRYEKWLRRQESRLNSLACVTGAVCAVRRWLFRPIPPGTLLDDVYWPLRVVMQGYRIVHETRARAHDRLPDSTRGEFARKVRTLTGNLQLLTRLPSALLPWCNPVWLQFVSHKMLRLAVPWALLVLLASSALLPGALYQTAFWAQVAFYLLALVGMLGVAGPLTRVASAAASFLILNTAAWVAFWVWASGRAATCWEKVLYRTARWQYAARRRVHASS